MCVRAWILACLVLAATGARASDMAPPKQGVNYREMEKGCAAFLYGKEWQACLQRVWQMEYYEKAYAFVLYEIQLHHADGFIEDSWQVRALRRYATQFNTEFMRGRNALRKMNPTIWQLN